MEADTPAGQIISDKEYEAVIQRPENVRYSYFIKRCADWEEAYAVYDEAEDTYALLTGPAETPYLPLWPCPRYAKPFLTGEWEGFQIVPMDVYGLKDDLIPEIRKLGLKFAIFPVIGDLGMVVPPEVLFKDLKTELENLGDEPSERIISDEEYSLITGWASNVRYGYFIEKCTEWEFAYGIYDETEDTYAFMADAEETPCLPLWPHPRFAEPFLVGEWADFTAIPVNVYSLMEELIPEAQEQGLKFAIFPVIGKSGAVVAPETFLKDLQSGLKQYVDI